MCSYHAMHESCLLSRYHAKRFMNRASDIRTETGTKVANACTLSYFHIRAPVRLIFLFKNNEIFINLIIYNLS